MADSWISTVDVDDYVRKLMSAESKQIDYFSQRQLSQLSKTQETLTTQISSYGQLQQLLSSFNTALQAFNSSFTSSYQSTLSSPTVASVKTTSDAASGNHQLTVTKLAKAASFASGVYTDKSSAQNISETLTLSIGPENSPTASLNITVKPTDSLQTIANNINANDIGINASIVSTSSGKYQLVVSSVETGLANKVNISESPSVLNGATIGLNTQLSIAQNAEFTFDNLVFNQPTNSNTISGMSLTLLSEGSSNILLTATNQTSEIISAAQDLVKNYNQILTYIEQTQAQTLSPDPLLSSVQQILQNAMGQTGNDSGQAHTLGEAGITFSQKTETIPVHYANGTSGVTYLNGLLQVNVDALSSALANNFSDIKALFNNSVDGLFTNIAKNILNPGMGSAWKALNDPESGGVVKLNSRLSNIKEQILIGEEKAADQKSELMKKYAALDVMLSGLQTQSRYISAQLQMMIGSK